MSPRRGEVWWVALDPTLGSETAKKRPCVVMTRDLVNEHRRTVVIIPLSSSPAAYPLGVGVNCGGRAAVAVVDQIRAIAKQRLRAKLGSLSAEEMSSIGRALERILDLG